MNVQVFFPLIGQRRTRYEVIEQASFVQYGNQGLILSDLII